MKLLGLEVGSATVGASVNSQVEQQYLIQAKSQQQDRLSKCLDLEPRTLDLEPQVSYLMCCIVKARLVLSLFPSSFSRFQIICLLLILTLILTPLSLDPDCDSRSQSWLGLFGLVGLGPVSTGSGGFSTDFF